MEPLNAYEIQELLAAMEHSSVSIPIGSLWTNKEANQIFLVLHHANMPTEDGPVEALVLQALPDGTAWIQPTQGFLEHSWVNMGFVWDRGVTI